jgi:hypothetical protein
VSSVEINDDKNMFFLFFISKLPRKTKGWKWGKINALQAQTLYKTKVQLGSEKKTPHFDKNPSKSVRTRAKY